MAKDRLRLMGSCVKLKSPGAGVIINFDDGRGTFATDHLIENTFTAKWLIDMASGRTVEMPVVD
jgi:hypothetical protein